MSSAQAPTPVPSPTPSLEEKVTQLQKQVEELNKKVEKPSKDIWDIISSTSGLVSGIVIALIGGILAYVYRERERASAELHNEQQLAVLQAQTIQGFMPQLQSGDEKAVEAALLCITALGNPELATKLATLFQTGGAVSALSKIASSPDSTTAKRAQQSLETLFNSVKAAVAQIAVEGKVNGSGFVVSFSGYLVTADFVISDPGSLGVIVGGKSYKANVVSRSSEMQLALLKIEGQQFPYLPITGGEKADLFDEFFVIGQHTDIGLLVRSGKILSVMSYRGQIYIQTQMQIAPGYAGAPAFNRDRQVIGMVIMTVVDKQTDADTVFLLPTETIKKFIDGVLANK
jgi:S1-C subfamily serine protease